MDLSELPLWLGDYINSCLDFLAVYLPDSFFTAPDNAFFSPILPYVNYFVPVADILKSIYVWAVGVLFYYDCQIIMRWFKVVS